MRRRLLGLTCVAVAVISTIVVLKVRASAADNASSYTTPWGDPDLQGIWTDLWQAPLERPAIYRDKAQFTEEERAELDRKRAAIPRMGDRNVQRGTENAVSGAYSGVFLPLRPTGPRTSLIVDPVDGKMPPPTPEARKRREEMRAFQLALMQATETCKAKDRRRRRGGSARRASILREATCVDNGGNRGTGSHRVTEVVRVCSVSLRPCVKPLPPSPPFPELQCANEART
jgi:hypothetical protein